MLPIIAGVLSKCYFENLNNYQLINIKTFNLKHINIVFQNFETRQKKGDYLSTAPFTYLIKILSNGNWTSKGHWWQ